MAAIRHLSRAPITEALIDIRAVPAKGFDPESLKQVKDQVRKNFPRIQERHAATAGLTFEVGQPPKAISRDLGFRGVWVRSADEIEVGQFRVDGFTFSRLKPYTSWEDILPKAFDLWRHYVGLVKPESVTRIAARYINHLPLKAAPVDLDDFLLTGPKLPTGIPDELTNFSSKIGLIHPQKKMNANVVQSLEVGVRSSAPTLLLDIEAFKTGDFDTSRATLETHLRELRDYKNEIFFGSITDDYSETFE